MLGFTQSHSGLLYDIEDFVQLIVGKIKAKKQLFVLESIKSFKMRMHRWSYFG